MCLLSPTLSSCKLNFLVVDFFGYGGSDYDRCCSTEAAEEGDRGTSEQVASKTAILFLLFSSICPSNRYKIS